MRYCTQCGTQLRDGDKFCSNCGFQISDSPAYDSRTNTYNNVNQKSTYISKKGASPYSKGLALILCCLGFFCIAGIHRIYVGKIWTGVLYIITGGLFAIGTIIDLVQILEGSFTDQDGRPLTYWDLPN